VGERDYDQLVGVDEINESIREAIDTTRPHDRDAAPTRPHRTRLWPFEDDVNEIVNSRLESITEPCPSGFVPVGVGIELILSIRVPSDLHAQPCR